MNRPRPKDILQRLAALQPGTTMCPGRLARDLGTTLSFLRPLLEDLHQAGHIAVYQSGRPATLRGLRGPFRVAPATSAPQRPPRPPTPAQDAPQKQPHHPAPPTPRPATPQFSAWIGVDFSGAGAPHAPSPGIRVFRGSPQSPISEVNGPHPGGLWSRKALAHWLLEEILRGQPLLIAIDHAFGLPLPWCRAHGALDWPQALALAQTLWPAHTEPLTRLLKTRPLPPVAEGWRLCDRWARTAKSVFQPGSGGVAHATLAGLPWLLHLRREAPHAIHFWPFDGWQPPAGKTVLAEAYPSLWRRRFRQPDPAWNEHQADAWRIAAWMQWADQSALLPSFWQPPLRPEEAAQARFEGWILGLM